MDNGEEPPVKKTSISENEINKISRRITREQHRPLARTLGLERTKIEEIERNCTVNQYGDTEIVCQMLDEWKQINGKDATDEKLISVLSEIGRTDIVHEIFEERRNGSHNTSQALKEIQKNQKKDFGNLTLPTSLWLKNKWLPLEELFVELSIGSKNKKGEEEHNPLDLKRIFDKIENRIPQRILIEGHPGYGKTTLITKILSDWSEDEEYLKDKFDLVFVIPLRNYNGEVDQHLLEGVKEQKEEVLKLIAAVEDRVLLLLDGLDECNEKIKESLIPLIKGDQHPNMTILVTCRTGHFHLNIDSDENFKSMGNKYFQTFSVWDKRIQIKGFTSEKRKEFLCKYLNVEISELDEKLKQSNLNLNEFYECPLFLLLLAVLLQETNVKFTESKTELYKTIFNFIINTSLEKLLGDNIESDMFDFKAEDLYGCRNLLINFGRLCLEKLKIQSLVFEESELIEYSDGNEIILKSGILSKQISFSNREEKNYYEPIHKSFLEFLAAFYLSFLDETKLTTEIKQLESEFDIWAQEDQLLFSFLGELLPSNPLKILDALCPHFSDD